MHSIKNLFDWLVVTRFNSGNFEQLMLMKPNELKTKVGKLLSEIKDGVTESRCSVRSYSPWLADFQKYDIVEICN